MQLINLVDFLLAGVFITFSIYLYTKVGDDFNDVHKAWIGWFCGLDGMLMLLVAFLSFTAIIWHGCRCNMYFSDACSLLLGTINFGAGCASFTLRSKFYKYLDDHGNDMGITDDDIDVIKHWYVFISCALFGSVILEMIRLYLSQGYRSNALSIDGEYNALLQEDEKDWQVKMEQNSSDRVDKYKDLRSYYKAKYAQYDREINAL